MYTLVNTTSQPGRELLEEIPYHFSDEEMDFETFPNVDPITIENPEGTLLSAAIVRTHRIGRQANLTGKVPGVLVIPGMFPSTQNNPGENLFSPTLGRWTQWLAEAGIYSMVLNPMGMGRSQGDFGHESIANLIDTWVLATQHLLEHSATDPGRIRIIGNSMGGHIAPRVATELGKLGITVDRMALQSPYFYSQLSERLPFGTHAWHGSLHLPRRYTSSPAFRELQTYEGQLFLSFTRYDNPPIPQRMQEFAVGQWAVATAQNRGTVVHYPYVKHNNRPLESSPFPHIIGQSRLRQRTLNQSAKNVVDFLAAA